MFSFPGPKFKENKMVWSKYCKCLILPWCFCFFAFLDMLLEVIFISHQLLLQFLTIWSAWVVVVVVVFSFSLVFFFLFSRLWYSKTFCWKEESIFGSTLIRAYSLITKRITRSLYMLFKQANKDLLSKIHFQSECKILYYVK